MARHRHSEHPKSPENRLSAPGVVDTVDVEFRLVALIVSRASFDTYLADLIKRIVGILPSLQPRHSAPTMSA